MTTLIDARCPVCTWVGVACDRDTCPDCGHGLVAYEVTLHG